jgi:crotonobetainyl-CoA:carnitine CoA-transferase CaiB-like acyl-CoA transferase
LSRLAERPDVLEGIRVLELGSEGALAGQILADFGADVVRICAPGLLPSPVAEAYADGKCDLTLDAAGLVDSIEALLASADVVIESVPGELLERLDIVADRVKRRHPQLIFVSISGFGRSGPKSDYAWSDLTVAAASGFLGLSGAADQAPVRVSSPQSHAHGSADAAVGILLALRHRELTGLGQSIDVSLQHSLTLALLGRALDAPSRQPPAIRAAGASVIGEYRVRSLFPAADGWVLALPGILPPMALFMRRLMIWVAEEGLCDAGLNEVEWGNVAGQMAAGEFDSATWAAVDEGIAALIADRSKHEIMAQAVARKLLVAPVLDVADISESEHFAARGSLVVEDGKTVRPGPFARFGGKPLRCRTGTGKVTIDALERRTPAGAPNDADASLPLAGVKILDLFWVVAGPGATRMLADYGATVVHVESRKRLDMLRSVPPYIDAVVDPERAVGFHSTQANKRNIALDLGTEEGRGVLEDLVCWADVVTESFAPGVIERMGFGYERLKEINPDVIMISSCLMGQSGPWRDYAGFGNLAAAVTGFHQLTGWPGEPPTGCFGPYTDFIGVRYNALAILAALAHRQRTGEGQLVDMSQADAALNFLTPALKLFWDEGHVLQASGNADPHCAPHGVYPCLGHDAWVAISVHSQDEWLRLCALVPTLRENEIFATLHGRKLHEAALNETMAQWSRQHTAEAVTQLLQRDAIAAHAVVDTHALYHDPQLVGRGHFIPLTHASFGDSTAECSRLLCSAMTPQRPEAAPFYGSHNREVLRDLLQYSDDRIEALTSKGVMV